MVVKVSNLTEDQLNRVRRFIKDTESDRSYDEIDTFINTEDDIKVISKYTTDIKEQELVFSHTDDFFNLVSPNTEIIIKALKEQPFKITNICNPSFNMLKTVIKYRPQTIKDNFNSLSYNQCIQLINIEPKILAYIPEFSERLLEYICGMDLINIDASIRVNINHCIDVDNISLKIRTKLVIKNYAGILIIKDSEIPLVINQLMYHNSLQILNIKEELIDIVKGNMNPKLLKNSIEKYPQLIKFLTYSEDTKDIFIKGFSTNPSVIQYIPEEHRTEEMYCTCIFYCSYDRMRKHIKKYNIDRLINSIHKKSSLIWTRLFTYFPDYTEHMINNYGKEIPSNIYHDIIRDRPSLICHIPTELQTIDMCLIVSDSENISKDIFNALAYKDSKILENIAINSPGLLYLIDFQFDDDIQLKIISDAPRNVTKLKYSSLNTWIEACKLKLYLLEECPTEYIDDVINNLY